MPRFLCESEHKARLRTCILKSINHLVTPYIGKNFVLSLILCKFACEIVESLCKCYLSHCSTNIASLTVAKLAVLNREYARHVRGLMTHKAVSP